MKKVGDIGISANYILFSLSLILAIFFFCPSVSAQSEEEMQILQMFFKEKDLVITPSRTPKPISQVAENISVITSEDIEEMNYHTLLEVLNSISGLQVDIRTPWAGTAKIQGTNMEYSIVKIDGVTVNYLSSNAVDFGAIPVQNIERIEIIKGPASPAWGSSLGGIINIITKHADDPTNLGGKFSASYGERSTGDYRAEVSGRKDNLGYYIYAGNFQSNGLRPNTDLDQNNLYTKLSWNIAKNADILFTFGYNKGSRGQGGGVIPEMPPFINIAYPFSSNDEFEYLFSTLTLNYSISHEADSIVSFRTSQKYLKQITALNTGGKYKILTERDKEIGGSAKFTWKKGINNMVIGADYDYGKPDFNNEKNNSLLSPFFPETIEGLDNNLENWAVYANDTITLDKLSLTPGIRYDHTNIGGDFLSPSLGITYKLAEKTILRTYIARGFNSPTLEDTHVSGFSQTSNPDLEETSVWSYQTGIETTVLNYLWLKASVFRHDISDAIDIDAATSKKVNRDKQRRQGFEIEMKTVPVYNTALFIGYAYVDADNLTTGAQLTDYAEYTYDIGLRYNDNKAFRATIKGHYIWWIPNPLSQSKHDTFIWDINLIKKIYTKDKKTVEAFLTGHNIFDGSQYLMEEFKNPRRWVEGGVRLKF